ncbi:ATP synthase F1 subunit delta [Cellulosilyticum ruminicola]|uniref:ATP synthase F1 subunit delta n=1 Tax=Cellulosilyticum ruminicola TaxID=425254 RepID=UPI0006CF4289|nr:ATP synthase F1 subunit delta [Cellulosilyticum ruminicola]
MAQLVVKRYATALFEISKEANALAQYEAEVKTIVEAMKQTPDFITLLGDAKVGKEEKISLIENIFGDKVSDAIVGLMVLMVRKSRETSILEVLEGFLDMVKKEAGIVKATVTSAIALSQSQLEQIQSKIEASTNSKVELETIIDESIIAGLIIKVADKVVDASIKGKMQTLKKQLSDIRLA